MSGQPTPPVPAANTSAPATATEGAGPEDRLDTRFREIAARMPDRTAVTDACGSVTYGRLAEEADAVTRVLRGHVSPGQPVALRAGRSRAALSGLLGILGAGASYLPVDPGYPRTGSATCSTTRARHWSSRRDHRHRGRRRSPRWDR